MKKYFAKYLPVDGEIKVGSMSTKGKVQFLPSEKNPNVICLYENGPQGFKLEELNLMKLFICSRDIQVGDVYKTDDDLEREWICIKRKKDRVFYQEGNSDDVNNCHKIIGEISAGAKWVKEGDEFDEEDINFIYQFPVRKTYRNGDVRTKISIDYKPTSVEDLADRAKEWAEYEDGGGHNYGYEVFWCKLDEVEVKNVKIKCDKCETFH